jgi:outer membrane protein OmpA-like peptidoglycan-associated protein
LKKVPIDVYQARNALAIAKLSGAATYASEIFGKAEAHMEMVERVLDNKAMRKQVIQHARRAVQFAEDARGRSVRRQQEEALENERREAAEREAEARARAAEAEARRIAEEEARARAEAEKAEADRRRMAAEQEKAGLRARLLQQFSLVLETRDTDRGLIVNISDVLFDTGQYALRPVAREKLARLSGIVLAYPGLRLRSEGHTDAIGSEVLNQRLSEQRAEAVREYLLTQGVPEHAVSSVGLGFSVPVASNDTREGRQQNRRVEIIVSGEVIGTAVGAAAAP